MKKAIKLTAALLLFSLLLCSCSSGVLLCSLDEDGRTYSAYGSDGGITSVTVTENGESIATLKVSQKSGGEPYTDDDGKNYGLTVADIDCDGYTDVVIQVSGSNGGKYRFFFGDGEGYDEYKAFANFKDAVFNLGDGLIGSTTDKTNYIIKNTDAPDVYIREKKTVYWTRNAKGGFSKISAEALTYYSETCIYCYTTYIWDEDEKDLVTDTEEWMNVDQLQRKGLEPFD